MPVLDETIQREIDTLSPYFLSFHRFCREVMGYADLTDEHEELCRVLQQPAPLKLILMPRYTFKSSIGTIAYSLWRLAREDSLRILIYSDSNEKAEAFLTEIKHHIVGLKVGSRFREIFGAWENDPKQGTWNQSQIVVRPRASAHAEPSIDTAGIESSKTGMHYDLILFDDLVTEKNVTTKELMDKTATTYENARSLLKPGGDIVLVGTRWHFGDLYGRLLLQHQNDPRFLAHVRAARVGDTYPFDPILTKDFLDQQLASQKSYKFSCIYQNAPVDDDSAAFKMADFRFYERSKTQDASWLKSLFITCCVDPAISQNKDADDTAITVVGTDPQWNLYLLDIEAGKFLPEDTLKLIFQMHDRWHLKVLGIETTAFQRMLSMELKRRLYGPSNTRQPFSINEFKGVSVKSKEQRILSLQPYHEGGRLRFPGERIELLDGHYRTLMLQMQEFPHSQHDDILDSLAYHTFIAKRGVPLQPVQDVPYTSAAWFEKEQQRKAIRDRARVPRWQRPPIPQLAFS